MQRKLVQRQCHFRAASSPIRAVLAPRPVTMTARSSSPDVADEQTVLPQQFGEFPICGL